MPMPGFLSAIKGPEASSARYRNVARLYRPYFSVWCSVWSAIFPNASLVSTSYSPYDVENPRTSGPEHAEVDAYWMLGMTLLDWSVHLIHS
jgi:hypothetical protein